MGRWPRIAEQQNELAAELDRIAEIDGVKTKIRERSRRRRLSGFPVDIAGELTDLIACPDPLRRRRSAGFRRTRQGQAGQQQCGGHEDRSETAHACYPRAGSERPLQSLDAPCPPDCGKNITSTVATGRWRSVKNLPFPEFERLADRPNMADVRP
jgi:hypothetical protein